MLNIHKIDAPIELKASIRSIVIIEITAIEIACISDRKTA